MDKFNYVIAKPWHPDNPEDKILNCYTYGVTVFYGTPEHAEDMRNFISSRTGERYGIYPVSSDSLNQLNTPSEEKKQRAIYAEFEKIREEPNSFLEELGACKNKHDVYLYRSEGSIHGDCQIDLALVLAHYKSWLIGQKIVKEK